MTSIRTAAGIRREAPLTAGKRRRRPGQGRILYVLAAAVFLAVLSFYPLIQLIRTSVSSVSSATLNANWDFVGPANFTNGFQQGDLIRAFLNTAVFVLVVTVIGLIGGLGAAIVLRHSGQISGLLLGIMVLSGRCPLW